MLCLSSNLTLVGICLCSRLADLPSQGGGKRGEKRIGETTARQEAGTVQRSDLSTRQRCMTFPCLVPKKGSHLSHVANTPYKGWSGHPDNFHSQPEAMGCSAGAEEGF